jgi:hypothetical protein
MYQAILASLEVRINMHQQRLSKVSNSAVFAAGRKLPKCNVTMIEQTVKFSKTAEKEDTRRFVTPQFSENSKVSALNGHHSR